MLQAVLRRKLTRAEEEMEDLLTSCTFGLMKYLPLQAALFPFLRSALNPLSGTRLDRVLEKVTRVDRWEFWPSRAYPSCFGCEPDAEIVLSSEHGDRVLLLIEAKYRSGKSSFAAEAEERPNDQLAREYDNATFQAIADGAAYCAVVYVTADPVCPVDELRESANEYRAKRGRDPQIFWTSWRSLPGILEGEILKDSGMATDLRSLLLAMDLTRFCRLRFTEMTTPAWTFQRTEAQWWWSVPSFQWSFDPGAPEDDPDRRKPRDGAGPLTGPPVRWELPSGLDGLYRWRAT